MASSASNTIARKECDINHKSGLTTRYFFILFFLIMNSVFHFSCQASTEKQQWCVLQRQNCCWFGSQPRDAAGLTRRTAMSGMGTKWELVFVCLCMWMNKYMNEWVNDSEWVCACTWMNEWVSEWMSAREWSVSECQKVHTERMPVRAHVRTLVSVYPRIK